MGGEFLFWLLSKITMLKKTLKYRGCPDKHARINYASPLLNNDDVPKLPVLPLSQMTCKCCAFLLGRNDHSSYFRSISNRIKPMHIFTRSSFSSAHGRTGGQSP
jgi:hypothetical protein